jgi:UDP-N-acetylmuramyl-tripeptide synthetase
MSDLTSYKLSEYAQDMDKANLLESQDPGSDPVITGLTYDSRNVFPGSLFVCKGRHFKKEYLLKAIDRGAVAYISEDNFQVELPLLQVSDVRVSMPILAQRFYNHPEKDVEIIGITGTKGKSTTACYLREILNLWQLAEGAKEVAFISTIDTYDGVDRFASHLTTPEAIELYMRLHNARSSGIKYLVMEVSSQGLKYNRLDGITYSAVAFLNISEDHISEIEHPDFDDYFRSKLRVFKHTSRAVIDLDQAETALIRQAANDNNNRIYYYSRRNHAADVYASNVLKTELGYSFDVTLPEGVYPFEIETPGQFNIDNALAAISLARLLGCPVSFMQRGLKLARTPGRMELFATKDRKILALVDYAHNKLSFEKLFETASLDFPGYRQVIIFGCPGSKGISRRHDLGTAAGRLADYIYLTEEDPRYEDVGEISREIGRHIEAAGGSYEIIVDRKEAIRTAFDQAQEKTLLLIVGKGAETTQMRGDNYEEVQSDVSIVQELIAEYDRHNP